MTNNTPANPPSIEEVQQATDTLVRLHAYLLTRPPLEDLAPLLDTVIDDHRGIPTPFFDTLSVLARTVRGEAPWPRLAVRSSDSALRASLEEAARGLFTRPDTACP